MSRGKQNSNTEKIRPATIPKPNDTTLRISFLHQAAQLLAQQSQKTNDVTSRLSKLYIEELHEVRNIQQTLLGRDLRRSYCLRCNRVWTPNTMGNNGVAVKILKKRAQRACTDCGATANFARHKEFKTRNEKVAAEKGQQTETSTKL